MDEAKVRFLFGELPDGLDPDDRAVLLARAQDADLGSARMALREAVANQIAAGEPPQVWATAQRLSGLGVDRRAVLGQLVIVFAHTMRGLLASGQVFDPVGYAEALDRLPLPSAEELEAALVAAVRGQPGMAAADAERTALERLGRASDDELVGELLERAGEALTDEDGPLAWLSGDRTVHVADLTAGVVLTHQLTDSERALGLLTVGFDLVGFARRDELRLPDGAPVTVYSEEPGHVAWAGPEGWLDGFGTGSVLAVRVDADGVVSMAAAAGLPAPDDALVARVRQVYEQEVDEPGLPVSAEELLLGLLLPDPRAFSSPRPPLAELCAAAGLERRGHEVAHDESIWANAAELDRTSRVHDNLDDQADRNEALAALETADDPDSSAERLRAALAGLRDPDVLDVVAAELLGDDDAGLDRARAFSGRLLAVARRPAEIAVARWFAAVVAERDRDVLAADNHLGLALAADPGWFPAVDRSAWYASDKGDAVTAAGLWRRLPDDLDSEVNPDLAMVASFTEPTGPKQGRNERCWCGSGRKYKACHLRSAQLPPLPERVGWLCRKATGYLERHGGQTGPTVVSLARARAVDPDDPASVGAAFQDPIVIDAALTEGGWFERFLADRGPLLPADEALLAAAWVLVPRTVYEVVEVRAGAGLTLADLATGDRLEVRERTFSRQASRGGIICARAVPDGETHQLVGGIFAVIPGTESHVLELCEQRRGHELCDYVGRQHRPPTLQTREGEPLVASWNGAGWPSPSPHSPA